MSPSEQVRQRLLEYGVTRPIHVIPTGMTEDRFVPGSGARFRAQYGIAPARPLVLNVGRVAHEKNLGFLLRMFVQVLRGEPDALLVIAGEGPARKSLEQESQRLGIAANMRFVGNLDRERGLNDCYAAADAFVFASRTETQGLVLLEAMAQSRPVVSTACLGTRSVLTAGSGACVVEEQEADFAAAVVHVLKDRDLRHAHGREGSRLGRAVVVSRAGPAHGRAVSRVAVRIRRVGVSYTARVAPAGLAGSETAWWRSARWWWTTRSPPGHSWQSCWKSSRSK